MTKISCPQEQCCYNGRLCVIEDNNASLGCHKCEECGCEPNMIDDNCDSCLSCSRDSGKLRWGNPLNDGKEIDINEIKEKEICPTTQK